MEHVTTEFAVEKSAAMLSRSLRLRKDTLDALKTEANKRNIGITVYMRLALEALVENIHREEEAIRLTPYGEALLTYPEL